MKQTMILLATVMMLAACSKEETDSNVISLSAVVNGGQATTRAVGSDAAELQNTQFKSGTAIHVEAYKTGADVYTNSTGTYTTTDGSGTLNGSIYYPSDGVNVDICAYYPSTITSSSTEFSVQTDQTTLDNYRSSDLMHATKLTNKAKGSTHNLTFNHAMAQIIVNIVPGDGLAAADITSNVSAVKIKSTVPTATLTITAGDINATNKAAVEAADISILGSGASNVGLIVPQSVAGGSDFIAVTYNGNTHTYSLPAGTPKVFAEGTSYTYTFTLTAAGIQLKSLEITNWADGGTVAPDAIII